MNMNTTNTEPIQVIIPEVKYPIFFTEADELSVRAKSEGKYDMWFASRALAENYKSLFWQYVCEVKYRDDVLADVDSLSQKYSSVFTYLGQSMERAACFFQKDQVVVCGQSLQTRIDLYKKHRIDDQLAWYEAKQEQAAVHKETVFVLTSAWATLHAPDVSKKAFCEVVKNVEIHFLSKHTFLMP